MVMHKGRNDDKKGGSKQNMIASQFSSRPVEKLDRPGSAPGNACPHAEQIPKTY
jgi:hypothetical protein